MWHIWHEHICIWVLMSVLRLKTRYYETDVTLTDDDTNSTVTDDANPNCNQRKRHPHVVKFVTCGKLCVNLLRRNNRMDWCKPRHWQTWKIDNLNQGGKVEEEAVGDETDIILEMTNTVR